jgi:beta-phosphoglucomutase-like phosphatase (HAD superfamily)
LPDGIVACRCDLDGVLTRTAAAALQTEAAPVAVFEDAAAGVAAGRAGSSGCVVSVARRGHADARRRPGTDVVVRDLGELPDAS